MLTRDIFQKLDITRHLSAECMAALYPVLMKNSYTRTYPSGETICTMGRNPNILMVVLEGIVASLSHTRDGDDIYFYYFEQYHTIGTVSCLSGSVALNDMVAKRDCVIQCIPKENYLKALELIPEFSQAMLRLVSANASRQIEISILARCKYARERLCRFLFYSYASCQEMTIPLPFSTEIMARYLGLTRSVLSRELHALERDGIIALSNRTVTILDLDGLRENI